MAHRPPPTRRRRPHHVIVATLLAASVGVSALMSGCTPRVYPSGGTPSPTASGSPSAEPPVLPGRPDATIPERPESDDDRGDGGGTAPLSCPDALADWVLELSGLIADDRVAEPVASDPAVDFSALAAPSCAFTGSDLSFTDIEEVEAASDVRVWVFADAATAAAHAEAVISALESAGYDTTARRDGADAAAHLLRASGTELADQTVVLTWGDPATAERIGIDPGQVAVGVDIVTFTAVP
ncbi:hypothetical protein H9651_01375 [Microbacterium sp. Sa4CUA7]|uniref:LytR/CpsA/Psr regulator C-terminal domain-containing protein n=1 Tax=Microbacterium pullorum TaxID=2762236 RepID=A0ABR8RYJ7_9MICO|nr:hypothetical protein [Microbacterium pullorum]MBD7956286.1 hypothetical protein [Microbacterium pullorum]